MQTLLLSPVPVNMTFQQRLEVLVEGKDGCLETWDVLTGEKTRDVPSLTGVCHYSAVPGRPNQLVAATTTGCLVYDYVSEKTQSYVFPEPYEKHCTPLLSPSGRLYMSVLKNGMWSIDHGTLSEGFIRGVETFGLSSSVHQPMLVVYIDSREHLVTACESHVMMYDMTRKEQGCMSINLPVTVKSVRLIVDGMLCVDLSTSEALVGYDRDGLTILGKRGEHKRTIPGDKVIDSDEFGGPRIRRGSSFSTIKLGEQAVVSTGGTLFLIRGRTVLARSNPQCCSMRLLIAFPFLQQEEERTRRTCCSLLDGLLLRDIIGLVAKYLPYETPVKCRNT